MRYLFACCLILISTGLSADTIRPFTSDGCSVFPDGTLDNQDLWLGCCIKHDLAYWKGGSYKQRVIADRELKACVEHLGERDVAKVMEAGVRVGGSPYFPTSYRWGYGWNYGRGYRPLSMTEKDQVKAQLLRQEQLLRVIREAIR